MERKTYPRSVYLWSATLCNVNRMLKEVNAFEPGGICSEDIGGVSEEGSAERSVDDGVFCAGDEHEKGSFSDGFSIRGVAFGSNAYAGLREAMEKNRRRLKDEFRAMRIYSMDLYFVMVRQ